MACRVGEVADGRRAIFDLINDLNRLRALARGESIEAKQQIAAA